MDDWIKYQTMRSPGMPIFGRPIGSQAARGFEPYLQLQGQNLPECAPATLYCPVTLLPPQNCPRAQCCCKVGISSPVPQEDTRRPSMREILEARLNEVLQRKPG